MSIQYKRTNWVRRLEDFSSACSSGFGLGQCLIAGILAIFSGISRLLPVTRWLSVTLSPDVPVVSTTGASSLKSPASIWRGVVFVAFIVGMMTMGHDTWARDFACNATIDLQEISSSYTPSDWDSHCSGLFCDREATCKSEVQSKYFDSSLWNKLNPSLTGAQKHQLCKQGHGGFRVSYGFDERKKEWNFTRNLSYSCLLYTSPSPRDRARSRMPSSA